MKKLLSILVLATLCFSAVAQKTAKHYSMDVHGLSPEAAMALLDLRMGKTFDTERYGVVTSEGQRCLSAFVLPAEGVDQKQLAEFGVRFQHSSISVLIPVERFEALATSGLCKYIDLGHRNELYNDRIRGEFAADYIRAGIDLPQGYDGFGVVVGVIDIGFEFTHPAFLDSTGATLRIKRVWNQMDTTGTAPEGFDYGSEYTTAEQILAKGCDGIPHTHGSHVAGIAVGCGAPAAEGRRYMGVAPAADLVLVPTTMQDPNIYDGIRYIHRYARSVGKPCVINMSLGSQLGSHDGLTAVDAAIENYIHSTNTDSIVLVASAGNDGSAKVHIEKQFTPTDSSLTTMIASMDDEKVQMLTDIWGEEGDSLDVQLSLFDYASNAVVEVSPVIRCVAGRDSLYAFSLMPDGQTPYEFQVVVTQANYQNARPNVRIEAQKEGAVVHPVTHEILLAVRSQSAHVNLWGMSTSLSASTHVAGTTNGDSQYSIGGVGANGTAVISVGSYNTRVAWRRPDNSVMFTMMSEGDVSLFSSHGPTIDGRTKPDITTPGSQIISSVNRFWPDYLTNNYLYDSLVWNGNTEYYATMQGTSMASPAATGVVALWLQHNPSLNVDSVRSLMHSSARHDSFTGNIGVEGDNIWGWGKLNSFGALPQPTRPYYTLRVVPENYRMGAVERTGRYPEGQVSITAVPMPDFVFTQWTDGNTDNPRVINLTSDTLFTAEFERRGLCDTIDTYPASLPFEENNCWVNLDGDGDGMAWTFMAGIAMSMNSTGNVNNWLLTPPIKVVDRLDLNFRVASTTLTQNLTVAVAEESADTADFNTVVCQLDGTTMDVGEVTDTVVSLSSFAGRNIRLAFHVTGAGPGIVSIAGTHFTLHEHEGIDHVQHYGYIVTTDGLNLTFAGLQHQPLTVYDALGRTVVNLRSAADGTYRLPAAGVYTLCVGNAPARKVVVVY